MALKELLTDLSNFNWNYENAGANNSPIGGRHGGYEGGGEPPHPEEHSKFDDKSGINLSKIKGRHGGYEGGGQPPHSEAHSKFDDGAGINLSKIKGRHGGTEPLGQPPHSEAHSLYDDGVGGIGNPQTFTVRGYTVSDVISGRHGGIIGPTPAQPPHSDDHSTYDNGVGRGVYPNDNPQSFDVRGYTVTGNKRFYIGWQGDIMNHPLSDYGIGAFDSIAGPFDHTQTRDKLRKVYSNYPELTFGADIDGGINGLNGSIHIGNQDLPEVVGGGVSYYGNLKPITPRGSIYRDDSGNYQVPQEGRNTNPPGGISNIPLFEGTKPESGFDRSLMYIPNTIESSTPVFKEFSRNDSSLIRIDRYSDNFDMNNSKFFEFSDTRPYDLVFKGVTEWAPMWTTDPVTGLQTNIDVTLDSTQPYIVRRIGDRWGLYEGDPEDGGEHLSGAIEWANALSGEFFRAPLDVMIDRSVADIGRIAKFLTSTKGALFLGKQFILQAFNPTIETKVYNPLSLGSVVPMIHINRHAGGKRYTDVVPSDSAVQSLADLSPGVEIGPIGVSGADIINAGLDAVGYDVPSFGRVEMQSPLATIHGEKIPLDKRVALSNPNRFLWPGALGFSTGTDAAISEASKIQKSQDIVLGRAKGQSDGGIKDLFQKTSFNKYDGGDNVYLTADGIMGTPEAEGPFGFLANLPISFSQLESQVTNALTDWASKKVADITGKKKSPEVEPLNPPPHRFDLLEQTNKSIPISGPLLNSPLVKVMDSYYPGMEGSYSFPNQLGGDLWPEYGYDYKYPIEFQGTPLIAGTTLPFAWGVSLARYATGDDTKHEGWTSWKISGASDIQPKLKDGDSPLAQTIVLGDNQEENWYEPGYGGTWNYFPKHNSLIGDGDARVWYGLSDDKTVHIDTGTGLPEATAKHTFAIPGSSRGMKFYITTPIDKPDGQTFGGISRGDRIFNDSFAGDLYKKGVEYGKGYTYEEGFTIQGVSENHISITNNKATRTVAYKGPGPNDDTAVGTKKTYTVDLAKPPGWPLAVPIQITGVFQGDQYSKDSTYLSNKGIGDNQYIQIGPAGGPVTDSETGKIIWTTPAKLTNKLVAISKTTYIHKFWPTTAGQKYRYANPDFEDEVGSTGLWVGSAAREGQLNIVPSFKDDVTGNSVLKSGGFISDLYDSSKPYSMGPSFTISQAAEPPKTSPLKKTRLQTDQESETTTRGEPVVQMATAHWKGQKGFGTRLETEGISTLTIEGKDELKPLKLFDFPWLNKTGKGANVGTEGQALGFIGKSGRTDELAGNLYGYPELGRSGIIKWPSIKTTMEIINTSAPVMCHNHDGRVGKGGVPIGTTYNYIDGQGSGQTGTCVLPKDQDQFLTEKVSILVESGQKTYSQRLFMPSVVPGEFPYDPKIGFSRFGMHKAKSKSEGVEADSQSPIAAKQIAYKHPAGAGVKESSGIVTAEGKLLADRFEVPSDGIFDESQRIVSKTTGVGGALDRYRTLAYGDIPTATNLDNRYEVGLKSASEIKTVSTDISKFLSHPGEGIRNKSKSKVDAQGNPGKVTTRIEIKSTGGYAADGSDLKQDQVTISDIKLTNDPNLGLIKKSDEDKYMTSLIDKVNMHPYGDVDNNDDFIKFKFFDLVNKKYIIFRASLSGVSETIAPEWSSERYIGRPDSVHVYQGVERSMSFEFMVVPTSKQELPVLWEKLNYLVGLTYPTWKKIGFGNRMEGPFMNLTIGDMYVDTPGFLSSLSITVDDNSPWELDEGFQLPHAISVSCEFTHIGKYPLASQGKHYDLGWLRKYESDEEWSDGNSKLGKRPMLGPTADDSNTLFKTPTA